MNDFFSQKYSLSYGVYNYTNFLCPSIMILNTGKALFWKAIFSHILAEVNVNDHKMMFHPYKAIHSCPHMYISKNCQIYYQLTLWVTLPPVQIYKVLIKVFNDLFILTWAKTPNPVITYQISSICFFYIYTSHTPERRQSKTSILSTNIEKK